MRLLKIITLLILVYSCNSGNSQIDQNIYFKENSSLDNYVKGLKFVNPNFTEMDIQKLNGEIKRIEQRAYSNINFKGQNIEKLKPENSSSVFDIEFNNEHQITYVNSYISGAKFVFKSYRNDLLNSVKYKLKEHQKSYKKENSLYVYKDNILKEILKGNKKFTDTIKVSNIYVKDTLIQNYGVTLNKYYKNKIIYSSIQDFVKKIEYKNNDIIVSSFNNGLISSIDTFDKDYNLKSSCFIYRNDDKTIRELKLDFYYNLDRQLLENLKSKYKPEEISIRLTEFNNKSVKTKEKVSNEWKLISETKLNDNGQPSKFKNYETNLTRQYTYEYDNNGNWINRTEKSSDNEINLIKRTITYY